MSLAQKLTEVARRDRWDERLQSMIEGIPGVDAGAAARTRAYMYGRIEKLQGMARDLPQPDAEEDLFNLLGYWYTEGKSEWFQFNIRLNYQVRTKGESDPFLMLVGGIGSALLGETEKLFSPEQIDALTAFLNDPISNAVDANRPKVVLSSEERELSRKALDYLDTAQRWLKQAGHEGAGIAQVPGMRYYLSALNGCVEHLRAIVERPGA